jgi:hypothetical protein
VQLGLEADEQNLETCQTIRSSSTVRNFFVIFWHPTDF